jgi:RecA/RadA recombinase
MVENNGKFLKSTISSLGLEGDSKKQSIKNAEGILTKVIESYESNIGNGQVGKTGTGKVTGQPSLRPGAIGLVYGRIQSGKTRAMITTTAMGFDNGFRVAVVMTSNINDLVTQTHLDFSKVLAGASVFTKDDELNSRVEDAKLDLEQAGGRILIITSKGKKSLRN